MKKTSVYLTEEEADTLRLAAEALGRSQAEIIRQGIRQMAAAAGVRPRVFRSLGKGHGGSQAYQPWDSDELYLRVMGKDS